MASFWSFFEHSGRMEAVNFTESLVLTHALMLHKSVSNSQAVVYVYRQVVSPYPPLTYRYICNDESLV